MVLAGHCVAVGTRASGLFNDTVAMVTDSANGFHSRRGRGEKEGSGQRSPEVSVCVCVRFRDRWTRKAPLDVEGGVLS